MEFQGKLGYILFFTTFTNPFFLTSYVLSETLSELNRMFFETGRTDVMMTS